MATIEVEDPHKVVNKTVNSGGQVYVGRELAGMDVQVVVSLKDNDNEE